VIADLTVAELTARFEGSAGRVRWSLDGLTDEFRAPRRRWSRCCRRKAKAP